MEVVYRFFNLISPLGKNGDVVHFKVTASFLTRLRRFFMDIFHKHEWGEWYDSHWNKHAWAHTRTMIRMCHSCHQKEEEVLELHCREFIRKGVYCRECAPYASAWILRTIDFSQQYIDNDNMKSPALKLKGKKGRPSMLARNIAMAIEYEFYPQMSMRDIGLKYEIKDVKTVFTGIANGRKYINMAKVKEAVG